MWRPMRAMCWLSRWVPLSLCPPDATRWWGLLPRSLAFPVASQPTWCRTGNDALLQGFTQAAAQLLDNSYTVNTLCNLFFGIASSIIITLVGWWVTERIVEPRVSKMTIDGDFKHDEDMSSVTPQESRAFTRASLVMLLGLAALAAAAWPEGSMLRGTDGSLTSYSAPIMKSIVPLIFLIFILPGYRLRLRLWHL
ncbi:Aminobenzoyl-glutamate transport protein [Kluyvera cryocrescens]|uniref:Aminobenzoyl-glutamate transport protein n=1 Tax=Kluyvera cryocrescens TaxID=580 RepID=A0A485CJ71_KLUCR|nr:Aminobenzoyl-glutamate transport protein [Kluyvera cryocrescens]